MRTVVVALVGFVVVLVAALPAHAQSTRDRAERVLDVVDALQLTDATMNKLMPAFTIFDKEREALLTKQVDLLVQIRLSVEVAPAPVSDKLLDQYLDVQRALVATEAKFVAKLRKLLRADQAKVARVMLLAPVPVQAPAQAAASGDPGEPRHRSSREQDNLFPPGSGLDPRPPRPCDPFASMHGC